jgi:hypothetical protein
MTIYALYLESGPRRKTTMAHVLELLGCFAFARTTEAAVEAAPAAIVAYLRYLQRHGEPCDPEAPFATELAEHVMEGPWLGYGNPAPGFGPDFDPLSVQEQHIFLQRLDWMRADLLDLLRDLPVEQVVAQPQSGRSLYRIGEHVVDAQYSYLRAALAKLSDLLPVLRALREDPGRLVPTLDQAWSITRARIESMTDAERRQMVRRGQVIWTARRMMRRMLEHEWEHLQEIATRLETSLA